MEPYLLCVIFWALLYGLARVLSEHDTSEATALAEHDVAEATALGEHDISEKNESPNFPFIVGESNEKPLSDPKRGRTKSSRSDQFISKQYAIIGSGPFCWTLQTGSPLLLSPRFSKGKKEQFFIGIGILYFGWHAISSFFVFIPKKIPLCEAFTLK